jgi:hypothetical protein
LRLLLLADTPEWAALLRECLAPMGDGAVLISAPNWDSVSRLFDDDQSAVLLTTPALQPAPGRCSLPCALLLEQEPQLDPAATVQDIVAEGVAGLQAKLDRYDELCGTLGDDMDDAARDQLNLPCNRLFERYGVGDGKWI